VLNGGDTGESTTGNGRHTEYNPFGGAEKECAGAAGGRRRAPCWVLKEQLRVFGSGWDFRTAKHGLVSYTDEESRP
jgi:hypothetical protein